MWRGTSIMARTRLRSSSSDRMPRVRPAAMARQSSAASWQVNALVEATPISGPAKRRHHHVALARDRRGRHVDDRKHVLLLLLGVAQRRQRVGGLARLRNEHREIARIERRLAVAELRGDVDLDRQPGEALEPVFGDQPRVIGRAAGRDRHPLDLFEIERQRHRQRRPARCPCRGNAPACGRRPRAARGFPSP